MRVGITIDGGIGKSYLDTLDVWVGKPYATESRLVARSSIVGRTLSEAASEAIEIIDG